MKTYTVIDSAHVVVSHWPNEAAARKAALLYADTRDTNYRADVWVFDRELDPSTDTEHETGKHIASMWYQFVDGVKVEYIV